MKIGCIILSIMWIMNLHPSAASEKFELKTTRATLSIDRKGNLNINGLEDEVIRVNSRLSELCKIVLENKLSGREIEWIPGQNLSLSKENNLIRLNCCKLSEENQKPDFKAELIITVKNDAFCFAGRLKCTSEEWICKEMDYPVISGISLNKQKTEIYWPAGLGERYTDPVRFGTRNIRYPGGSAGMAWFSLNTPEEGIYVGVHDSLQESRDISLLYDQSSSTFKTRINARIYAGEYEMPDVIVNLYRGDWYAAAKFYRNWYSRHFSIITPPQWVKEESGWVLAILKQQNMEVMWPYPDIDKLCDIADRFNLGAIGLFGWAVGGHDHYYPNYTPDNLMGGRVELVKAIKRAHERGKKIILYANGKLMDTSTDFYRYNGYETMVKNQNRQPDIQYYIKQKNGTPVIFAQACTGSALWRKTMLDLGLQAVSLGADGILYDQVGGMGIYPCFAEDHDHRCGIGDARNRLLMISEISKAVKKINPDFVVMTEDTNDDILRSIDFHHGCATGSVDNINGFPAMIRYTFPELLITQRNPNPLITNTDANFAVINGLRHEIETRYPADREYLLNGTLPTHEDYENVVSPPNVGKMNLLPADEATKYVRDLIAFENRYPEFFRYGKFIALDGIKLEGTGFHANGFQNGNKIGVLVWNRNQTKNVDFSVSVPDYQLIHIAEPGNSDVASNTPLEANAIRLLIFEKHRNNH